MVKSFRLLLIIFSIVFNLSAFGQSITVQVAKEQQVGRPFTIVYSLQSSDDVEITHTPNFAGLELLYGPALSASQNYSIVNGKVSSSSRTDITYTLISDREGRYKVSGLQLKIGNKTLTAKDVEVNISSNKNTSSSHGSQNKQYGLSDLLVDQGQYKYHAIVPGKTVYEQEALPVIYRLQSTERPNITNVQQSAYDGFISLDLLGNEPRQMKVERVGGTDWVVIDIMKELLFAQRAGELTIPSNDLSIRYTYKDPGGDPFLGLTREKTLSSEEIKIKVLPLPQEGKPNDFSGAVGNFFARYETSHTQWKTNEASSLKLILEGQGNLKVASLPQISLPEDVEVYDPVENTQQTYTNGVLKSIRTIEYSLIPRKIGLLTIPSVHLNFFNTQTGKYQTTATKELKIKIVQGRAAEKEEGLGKVDGEHSENMPYSLIDSIGGEKTSYINWSNLLLWHVLLFVVFVVCYKILLKELAKREDNINFASSRAKRKAQTRLKTAKNHLANNEIKAFHGELLQAIWGYLSDKLRIPQSNLSRDLVNIELQKINIAEPIIIKLNQLIDNVEYARFSSQKTEKNTDEELLQQAEELLTAIENTSIKGK